MKKIFSGVFAVFSLFAILAKADTLPSSGIPSTKIYPHEEGKRIVETFGEEYMPNAFSRYEKARDKALELEQVFTEEFPRPVEKGEDLYSTYEKVRSRLFSVVSEYRNAKDILAHFYFLQKAGVETSESLSEFDEKPCDEIALDSFAVVSIPSRNILETKQAEFAEKFMPETFALYQILAKEYDQTVKLYDEMCAEREKAGFRFARVFFCVAEKGREIASELDILVRTYNKLYMEHRIGDIGADKLAEEDKRISGEKHAFFEALTIRIWWTKLEFFYGPAIEMVPIPRRLFMMGRTEVTQAQWESIMGNNPSKNKGPDLPVENVSWYDCQEFIKKLNAMTGKNFRLPTGDEWEYACRAGGTGDWGKRANGEEGPLGAMGWYDGNSDDHTHPVGQKEPNAFGLYDMHGNVWEWTATADGANRVHRGGSYWQSASYCSAFARDWYAPPRRRLSCIGFRLACDRKLTVADLARKAPEQARTEKVPVELTEADQARIEKELVESMVPIPGRPFMMGRTEVTQAQWESIMGNNPSENKGPDLPVENVSWYDCQRFIKKLNAKTGKKFRLPTEDEWVYACCAGGTGDWGKRANGEEGPLDAMGWYKDNSDRHMHPVGQKEPNAFGLYDMHGNVWEWTATADGANRVHRGGCYWDNAGRCTASRRGWSNPDSRYSFFGFRLACDRELTAADQARIAADQARKENELVESMVAIPGRDFMMGRTEVTQTQWESIMGNNPSKNKGPYLPVENVSWNDCQEFIKKLNEKTGKKFRLPTEVEWEYACRAGGTGDWGKRANGEEGLLDAMGWYRDKSDWHMHPVGQKEPNAFGLYDMHGNVWEWTATADGANRVARGGGFWDSADLCTASFRLWYAPDRRVRGVGFRLALSQD